MLYGIIGILLGGLLVYMWVRPALKKQNQLNIEIQSQNEQIQQSNTQLKIEGAQLNATLLALHKEESDIRNSISSLEEYKKSQENNLEKDYQSKVDLLELKFKELEKEACQTYEELLKDNALESADIIDNYKLQIDELSHEMSNLKSEVQAAQQEYKRSMEEAQQEDFYTLQLQDIDKQEIKWIKSVEPHLRDATPLNKIIWSAYYRTAYNNLKGRVIGPVDKTGIYKLVNNIDGRVYIGQAKEVGARWGEHIKAGLGASAAPANKLYTAMRDVGPENFSFILLEECPVENLNQQEKFWIEFYDSKNIGMNMTEGGS